MEKATSDNPEAAFFVAEGSGVAEEGLQRSCGRLCRRCRRVMAMAAGERDNVLKL